MTRFLPILHPQHAPAMSRGARCLECSLYGAERGPIPSRIFYGANAAVSGEAPGGDEVEASENFVGWSGGILDECLWNGGQTRYSTTIINAIACQQDTKLSLEEYEEKQRRQQKRALAEIEKLDARRAEGLSVDSAQYDALVQTTRVLLPTDACRGRFALDLDEAAPRVYVAVGKFALAEMQDYLRARFAYDGDDLVMARMHGAPVPLATPRQALERAQSVLMRRRIMAEEEGWSYTADPDIERVVKVIEWSAKCIGWDQPRFLFGSYHPAFAAKGRSPQWMSTVCMNISRAVSVATRGSIDWSEPRYIIAPPVQEALDWLARACVTPGEGIVDLETCDPITGRPSVDQHRCAIRTIGLWNRKPGDDESILVVPFRHMDGSLWEYTPEERASLAVAYRTYFDTHALAGHNVIPFDSEIVLRPTKDTLSVAVELGGDRPLLSVRNRLWEDTRVLVHNTRRQDLPKTLSETGRWYLEVPEWKSKEDVASTDNADDGKLMLRCGRDVLVTGRVIDQLRRDVERDETLPQHVVDRKVGHILRDMSELGMCVDERERGRLSRVLNIECDRLLKEWYELVGKEVNPRSVPQMQTLLFEDWGIEPPINTGGDWSKSELWDENGDEDPFESDEGSTGAQAILRIIDAIDEKTLDVGGPAKTERVKRALDKVLEFKALDKPRGSYSDNIDVRPWPGPRDPDTSWRVDAEGALLERDVISWVRGTWAIPVTPVGRSVVAKPGLQQIPALGRKVTLPTGETIDVNMRRVYRAAPGHVFVAADFMQSHVRIYYAVAQDEVGYETLRKKLNPHIQHAATMLAEHPSKIQETYDWLWSLKKTDPDGFEYWKLVAKKFVFGTIYLAEFMTIYKVMKKERERATGKRSFPNLKPQDCEQWEANWYTGHPATRPWQELELALYEQRGYAMSAILDQRRRYAPLDMTMIPNHAILAFEGSLKNKALIEIAERIPHRGWSDWSGLVGDFHDCPMVQVPIPRAHEACKIVVDAMGYRWRDMDFGGEGKIGRLWGAMSAPEKWKPEA